MNHQGKNMLENMEKVQTRREFLVNTAKVTAGAIAFGSVGSLLNVTSAFADETAAPEHPFKYAKLDPEKTKELGYQNYFAKGGCGMGAFSAIIEQLTEAVGYPFNQIPVNLFANASAGYGAASLCGSLGGAAGAIALVTPPADAKTITADLFSWYRSHAFPEYQPEFQSATTVADSVNCADSLNNFMTATGLKMGDDGRKARCASVTGETAAKAVELLNAYFGL